jgi:hypothetical protein
MSRSWFSILVAALLLCGSSYLSVADAAVSSWLSSVGTVGGGFTPGDADIFIPGFTSETHSLYLWLRNDARLQSAAYNISATIPGVIKFVGVEVFNPDVVVANIDVGDRWNTPTGPGKIGAGGQSITNMAAVNVNAIGLDLPTRPFDELYDPIANAALFARIDFQAIGLGATQVKLTEGDTLIVENSVQPPLTFGSATVSSFIVETSEIEVAGNGILIDNGDNTPSLSDNTDFGMVPLGSVQERTFEITDLRFGTTLQPPVFTGPFSLVGDFPTFVSGAPVSFTVGLNTSALGDVTGGISFGTDNPGQNPYHFALAAQIVPEPVSASMAAIALGAMVLVRRRSFTSP